MNIIDRFLNNITMYRLVMYYLMILVAIAAIFAAVGWLPYSPISILFSACFLAVVTWAANGILAYTFKVPQNSESAYITAFILTLVISPSSTGLTSLSNIAFLAWAAVLAMASKYFLAINKKHVFNPTAIALVITGFALNDHASWWVGGNLPLMPFVIIGGLLVLRKIQRFDLAGTFFVAALASDVITHASFSPLDTIEKALLHTPLFFFASIMITEPLTTPPTRSWRIAYGAFVGAIFSPFITIGAINSSPELALVVGNIFSYIVSPKGKRQLTLTEKNQLTPDIYEFVFATDKPLRFRPGQYLEWTLGHNKIDGRGNRRYFTVASSPTERDIRLGVKFYEPSSSFKQRLLELKPGDTIMAGQLAGDFTLPKDMVHKLAFIAGGIGITPFRSMIKNMLDQNEKRDVVLLYSNHTAQEIAYRPLLDEASQKLGMKIVYAITDETGSGTQNRITPHMIAREIPDYRERTFYISGTHAMTNDIERALTALGVPRTQIKVDFFPGFA